jgi:hypothetical protein
MDGCLAGVAQLVVNRCEIKIQLAREFLPKVFIF